MADRQWCIYAVFVDRWWIWWLQTPRTGAMHAKRVGDLLYAHQCW